MSTGVGTGKKVLLVVTSSTIEFWPGGLKTGYFFTEALHPYLTFKNHGYEVVGVSETGTTGIDQSSIPYAMSDAESRAAYNDETHPIHSILGKNLKKPSDVNAKDYDILFVAGGHGASKDLPTATGVQKLAAEIYANGGVVSAVCHGPAIFAGAKDPSSGELIIKGKKATGFSTRGEKVAMALDTMKKLDMPTMEEVINQAGGIWVEPHDTVTLPTTAFTVDDQRIVTGVNPASAADVAQRAVEITNGGKAEDKRPRKAIL